MKYTAKQTILFFEDNNKKNDALLFLDKLNIPYRTTLNRANVHLIYLAPSKYKKHHLDLYLQPTNSFSIFNYKP